MSKEFLDLLELRTIRLMLAVLKSDSKITRGGLTVQCQVVEGEINFIEKYLVDNPLEHRGS